MDDDMELHPAELLSLYGIAGSFLEARISRLGHAETEAEQNASDLLALGIAAIVESCGPSVTLEIEREDGVMSDAASA